MATSDGGKKDPIEKRLDDTLGRLFAGPASSSSSRPAAGELSPFQLNGSAEDAPATPAPSSSPQCSSWSRADMFKRLATYKSGNWFAKPESAGPFACARRGWSAKANDTIACDYCGSYLSFPIPNNWPKAQIEKAAMEFSEKLTTAHKTLCPWKESACPEEFTQFPPTTVTALVQGYNQRLASLKDLSAVPKLTPEVIPSIRTLKPAEIDFLLPPASDESMLPKESGPEQDFMEQLLQTYDSYHQALKLISLTGWELRVLPYAVEDDKPASEPGPKVSLQWDNSSKAVDPSSAVLDCKLCGASVGLWGFDTVNRTNETVAEFLDRFKKPAEVVPAIESTVHEQAAPPPSTTPAAPSDTDDHQKASEVVPEEPSGLNLYLTIAGGPRPARLPAVYPAYIPLPGPFGQKHMVPEVVEQPTCSNITGRDGDDEGETTPPPAPRKKRPRPDGDQVEGRSQKVQKAEASSVEAVETTQPNKNENSAESVDCTPREGEVRREAQMDAVCRLASYQTDTLQGSITSRDFDPIQHHRYFCPWTNANGGSACGWQLTIDALYAKRKNVAEEPVVRTGGRILRLNLKL